MRQRRSAVDATVLVTSLLFTLLGLLSTLKQTAEARRTEQLGSVRKSDILKRLQWQWRSEAKRNVLRPRASAVPCAGTIYQDSTGSDQCCVGTLLTDTLSGDPVCCPTGVPVAGSNCGFGPSVCCNSGGSGPIASGVTASGVLQDQCCYGVIYEGGAYCCPTGQQLTQDGLTCCSPGQTAQGNTCVSSRMTKRDPAAVRPNVPLEEGETRTPLNAQQVAQYLTQGGMFEHEGEIFIDPLHREHNKNFLGKMIGGGLSVGIRQLAKHHTFTAQADRAPFYELSNNYRFAWTDAPEIYARIAADPNFERFYYHGVEFDKETIHRLVSQLPNYNQTIVDQIAEEYELAVSPARY